MTSPFEVARHWWEYYRERPFLLLVRLFVERIFRGGGDDDMRREQIWTRAVGAVARAAATER